MKSIVLEKNTNDSFSDYFLPIFLKNIIISNLYKNKNSSLFDYILYSYGVSFNQIINCLKEGNSIICKKNSIDKQIRINDNINLNDNYKLITILEFIDCGNLSISGINIITKSFNFIKNNLSGIYRIFLLKRGKI